MISTAKISKKRAFCAGYSDTLNVMWRLTNLAAWIHMRVNRVWEDSVVEWPGISQINVGTYLSVSPYTGNELLKNILQSVLL